MDFLLSPGQYGLVYNLMSLTVATMFAAGLFFFGARAGVAPKYRPALLVSGLVVFIAGYHYFRILGSWEGAFTLTDDGYAPSGQPFNDVYRYADWLITVPLLMVELVAALGLSREKSGSLLKRLTVATLLMLGFGYVGENAAATSGAWIWWAASMVPFLYILKVLFGELSQELANENGKVKSLLGTARTVVLVTWSFYPIAYIAPLVGLSGATGEVALQVGYTIADITAKALYGVVIYMLARAKSEAEGYIEATDGVPATQKA